MFAIARHLIQRTSTLRAFTSTSFRPTQSSLRTSSRQFALYSPLSRNLRSSQTRNRIDWRSKYRQAFQQHQTRHYRQPFSYQRFHSSQSLLRRWAAQPTFYYQVGGIGGACGLFYIYNLDTVPVSGRRRFNIISPEFEASMGRQMYQETIQQYRGRILPPTSREHRMVQRVLDRLVPHSGLEKDSWEIHVIDDPQKNAFVIPGGKVFVFSGILDTCQGEDGLAAVLGHEIAHNVAHHAAERMSQGGILMPLALIGSLFLGISPDIGHFVANLAFTLPHSRSQESEADYIGLLMMAEACYFPQAAVDLWARMEKDEHGTPMQFLSTHPSSHNRMGKITDWLPEAELKREDSECDSTGAYRESILER